MSEPTRGPNGRSAPSLRGAYASFSSHDTRWKDNDVYGHLNNVVHYTIFDSAVNGWLIRRGLLDLRSGAQIGLVVEAGCRYHSELRFPDSIIAGLRVTLIGSSSVRYEVGLFRDDAETAAADGFFVHVYVDAKTRRPAPIEAGVRTVLETLVMTTEEPSR